MADQLKPKYPSSEDEWTAVRPVITQLYSTQDWPLPKLMEYMEKEHLFKATTKMYKDRFKTWGITRKHYGCSDVAVMIRKKRERDAVGKKSEFFLRGRKVNINDVVRSWNRKQQRSHNQERTAEAGPSTPEYLTCRSPVQSPLQSPADLHTLETIFFYYDEWMKHALSRGVWRTPEQQEPAFIDCIQTIRHNAAADKFLTHQTSSLFYWERGDFARAGVYLRASFRHIDDIISGWSKACPDEVVKRIRELQRFSPALVEAMGRYIAALSQRLFNKDDFRYRLFSAFGALGNVDLWELELRLKLSRIRLLGSNLGQMSVDVLFSCMRLALQIVQTSPTTNIDHLLPTRSEILAYYDKDASNFIRLSYTYIQILLGRNRFGESESMCRYLIERCEDSISRESLLFIWTFFGVSQYSLGKLEAAKQSLEYVLQHYFGFPFLDGLDEHSFRLDVEYLVVIAQVIGDEKDVTYYRSILDQLYLAEVEEDRKENPEFPIEVYDIPVQYRT